MGGCNVVLTKSSQKKRLKNAEGPKKLHRGVASGVRATQACLKSRLLSKSLANLAVVAREQDVSHETVSTIVKNESLNIVRLLL